MNCQLYVRHPLTDIGDMDFLIELWREANGIEEVTGSILVILSAQLEAPDIFSHFVLNACAFRDLVMEHFEQVHSSLFMCQLQSIDSRLTCCLVYVITSMNGRGNESTIVAFEAIATQLRESLFTVLGYVFDGDPCFNHVRDDFQDAWEGQLSSGPVDSFFGTQMIIPVVISDPLHLLKWIW
jgi:hypothetical protein